MNLVRGIVLDFLKIDILALIIIEDRVLGSLLLGFVLRLLLLLLLTLLMLACLLKQVDIDAEHTAQCLERHHKQTAAKEQNTQNKAK